MFRLDTNLIFHYSLSDSCISKVNVGRTTDPTFLSIICSQMVSDPILVHNTLDTVFNTYNLDQTYLIILE